MNDAELETPRCSFPTSECRYDSLPTLRTLPKPNSIQNPPILSRNVQYTASPPLVKISPGVYRQGDETVYTSEWPPVQEYLAEALVTKRLPKAPSDVVFTLAALELFDKPHNPVHWLLWECSTFLRTAKVVNRIALHQPPLIKTHIPWTGNEHQSILNCYQEKFVYLHIRQQWYPYISTVGMTSKTKRILRSSDPPAQTVQSFFDLPEEPPLKRRRRAPKEPSPSQNPVQRRGRAKPKARASSSSSIIISPVVMAPAGQSSVYMDPLQLPPEKTPISTTSQDLPIDDPIPDEIDNLGTQALLDDGPTENPSLESLVTLSPSHSRNRSISQSSADTLVDEENVQCRSASVVSVGTVVENLSPKKRKLANLDTEEEPVMEFEGQEGNPAAGMVTRGRASKLRHIEVESGGSQTSSRTNTPIPDNKRGTRKPYSRAKRNLVTN